MTSLLVRTGAMVLLLGSIAHAHAQNSPDNADPEQLQTKSSLTEEERTALTRWVSERVRALGTDQPGVGERYDEIRKAFTPTASAAYREAFASAVVESVRSGYLRTSEAAAARMLTVVNLLDQVDPASPLLIAALKDRRIAVRAAAAIGLARLRRPIATAGGEFYSNAVNALREAAKTEQAPIVLMSIYRALDYPAVSTPPDPKALAVALLDVLEARAEQYAQGRPTAEGADFSAIRLAGQLADQLDDAQKKRLATALAQILTSAAQRYKDQLGRIDPKERGPVAEMRNRVEKTIIAAEDELKKLINPQAPPNLTSAMMETSDPEDKRSQMNAQLDDWINSLRDRHGITVRVADREGNP